MSSFHPVFICIFSVFLCSNHTLNIFSVYLYVVIINCVFSVYIYASAANVLITLCIFSVYNYLCCNQWLCIFSVYPCLTSGWRGTSLSALSVPSVRKHVVVCSGCRTGDVSGADPQ